MKNILLKAIGIFHIVIIWEILAYRMNTTFIPHIQNITDNIIIIVKSKVFYESLKLTLLEVVGGVLIALIISIIIASIMVLKNELYKIISIEVDVIRHIPTIALFPLLMALFGISPLARIILITLNSFPSILLTTYYSLNSTERNIVEAGRIEGANEVKILMRIKYPLAVGEILNGLKIAIGNSFVAVVVAEMLGATSGLGYMIMWETNVFNFSKVYAYLILLSIVGIIINVSLEMLIKKYKER